MPRTATPPTIDGIIRPVECNGADPAKAMVVAQGIQGEKVEPRSVAWLLADSACLYVAIDNAVDKATPLTAGQAWGQDDAVELAFRDPALGKAAPILVLRGYANGRFESSDEAGAPPDAVKRAAEGVVYKATAADVGRWVATWRVPFAAIGVDPKKSTKLAFNLSVHKTAGPAWVMWVGTDAASWEVGNAGTLALGR